MKEFTDWTEVKMLVNERQHKWSRKGDVWWCALGLNVGHEQDGKGVGFVRPVVILANYGKSLALVAPTTTSKSTEFKIIVKSKITNVLIDQIRIVDTKRFIERVGKIERHMLEEMKNAIKAKLS